jgi:hypothetical protein
LVLAGTSLGVGLSLDLVSLLLGAVTSGGTGVVVVTDVVLRVGGVTVEDITVVVVAVVAVVVDEDDAVEATFDIAVEETGIIGTEPEIEGMIKDDAAEKTAGPRIAMDTEVGCLPAAAAVGVAWDEKSFGIDSRLPAAEAEETTQVAVPK